MVTRIDDKRLAQLRAASEIGIRLSGLATHNTVHVVPDELASLLEEVYIAREQARPRAALMIRCLHCRTDVALETDVDALRNHALTCSASPAVQELERLRRIVAQAEVVSRHWHDQDGVNSAELDKLKDLVLGEEANGV